MSVKEDLAFVGVVQARRQFQDRALPSAVRPHNDLSPGVISRRFSELAGRTYAELAWKELERDVPQGPLLCVWIFKRDISVANQRLLPPCADEDISLELERDARSDLVLLLWE